MLDFQLRQLRNVTLGGMTATSLRFFEPTEAFFQAMSAYKDRMVVDAGAGMGHVSAQLEARGHSMLPVDIMPREGQSPKVVLLEAESLPYGDNLWLMLCRPDHSGWAYDTMELALRRGAGVFYAGLERNFDCDLGDYVGRETKRWSQVGEEGEDLFLFMPSALLGDDDDFGEDC